jgi:hypothetical protein
MTVDIVERFREKASLLGGAQRKKRLGELREEIRTDAVALIALASEILIVSEKRKRLERLLDELRVAVEELRGATESEIALVLELTDEAARAWEAIWAAALADPSADRTNETKLLRRLLEDTGLYLQETLRRSQEDAGRFERPLARLDELEARTADFPLWSRECLARWEMLDKPAPPLDPERIARAQAARARGECEDLDDLLSRVEAGGPWVEE